MPGTPSEAKTLVIKHPASGTTKQPGRGVGGRWPHHTVPRHRLAAAESWFALLGNICTNKQNNSNDHQKGSTVTAENHTPSELTAVKWEGALVWQREIVPPKYQKGVLDQGLPECLNLLQCSQQCDWNSLCSPGVDHGNFFIF